MDIRIDGRHIGDGFPCYTVAEIGSNFDQSIDRAKKLIDLAKEAGADAVKFQCFSADRIVSEEGFKDLKIGFQQKWDKPVYEVYQGAEFPRDWNLSLFEYCKSIGIDYFSSPYDFEAVDLLDEIGVDVFKIGSGDITWLEMVEYIANKRKPVLLGTGASTREEVEEALDVIRGTGNEDIVLLQCVTNYPSSFDDANILTMQKFRETYDVLVGYSDHTPGYVVPMGATALGACVIEKHFTDDKNRPGPDHPFAMDFSDFKTMVDNIRLLESSMGSSDKIIYPEEEDTVILQRRSIVASRDIREGEVLSKAMLDVLRPAPKGSVYPKFADQITGKTVKRKIRKGSSILWNDIED